jgi:DNA-directed RNA polymerase subunit RPC12/RpoP
MERLEYLKKELKHITSVNKGSPFPLFDTEYVELVTQEIINMKDKIDYNEDPVYACKHCKALYIEVDNDDNDMCMRCGSINEIIEYKDIFEYKEKCNK